MQFKHIQYYCCRRWRYLTLLYNIKQYKNRKYHFKFGLFSQTSSRKFHHGFMLHCFSYIRCIKTKKKTFQPNSGGSNVKQTTQSGGVFARCMECKIRFGPQKKISFSQVVSALFQRYDMSIFLLRSCFYLKNLLT